MHIPPCVFEDRAHNYKSILVIPSIATANNNYAINNLWPTANYNAYC